MGAYPVGYSYSYTTLCGSKDIYGTPKEDKMTMTKCKIKLGNCIKIFLTKSIF